MADVDMAPSECPFCKPDASRILMQADAALAIADGFPVAEGHTLVIPRRHVASLFNLTEGEQSELWKMVVQVRGRLQTDFKPDGFTIGLNDGRAAGQTVMHAHVHVIPRHVGDVADPRGGIRWVLPAKANYRETPSP